ncbi:MAG TPA: hypothetical protein VG733_14140 [Chthoniobacteraceae bacterium]|nr:hypothetical protein [Chthoniobacteraceae bacterium]
MLVEECTVTANRCFVPEKKIIAGFDLYLLDVDGMILLLFGEWMFDPYALIVDEESFERWDPKEAFFKNFTVRYLAENGNVLNLRVHDGSLIKAEPLPCILDSDGVCECRLFPGSATTVLDDMAKAGLIEDKSKNKERHGVKARFQEIIWIIFERGFVAAMIGVIVHLLPVLHNGFVFILCGPVLGIHTAIRNSSERINSQEWQKNWPRGIIYGVMHTAAVSCVWRLLGSWK